MIAIAVVAIAVGLSAFTAMAVKDRTYVGSPEFSPTPNASSDNVVYYYSRSGHSEAVAREVARKLDAPIEKISADYGLNFSGQGKALLDAEARALPTITVNEAPLKSAKRVYLVSPTWMFRPAPPLWTFVSYHDLHDKEVVLIMTGNSRFKKEEIDEFAHLVQTKGGRLIHHIFIQRGRIYWQMSRDELLGTIDTRLEEFDPRIINPN